MSASRTLEQLRGNAAGSTALADAPPPRRTLAQLLDDPKVKTGLAAVAGKHLSADRILKLTTNALYRTPALALCNPTTVLGALMASCSLGLEPNTPAGHAYLIPYKRSQPRKDGSGAIVTGADGRWIWDEVYECQFQLGYRGLIVLAYRSPRVGVIDAEAIHRLDTFTYRKGSGAHLNWALPADLTTDRGPLIGAYCHTSMTDGGESFTVMPLPEIVRIRDRSETFTALQKRMEEARTAYEAATGRAREKLGKDLAKAEKNYRETPWVQWEDAMAIKSVIKRHVSQRMPLDPGDWLQLGVDMDNAGERGVIDLSAFANPDTARALAHDGVIPAEAQIERDDVDEPEQEPTTDAGSATTSEPSNGSTPGAEPDASPAQAASPAAGSKSAPPADDEQTQAKPRGAAAKKTTDADAGARPSLNLE